MSTQGLNDDVDDGLDLSAEPTDLNPNQPIPDKVIFRTSMYEDEEQTPVTTQELFGIGVVKNEVPNLNAEFQLVTEKINKLADLDQVRLTIKDSNGICKEDAEVVNSLVPGFISPDKPIGFFTDDKSRTQLNETLNTINKSIDTQTAEIVIQASDIAEKSSKALSACFTDIETKIISKLSALQDQMGKLPLFLNTYPAESYHTVAAIAVMENCLSVDCDDIDAVKFEKFPGFMESFQKACQFTTNSRRANSNVSALLTYCTNMSFANEDNTSIKALHQLVYDNFISIDENGIVTVLSPEESNKIQWKAFSFYHLAAVGASHLAKDYLMLLVKAAMQNNDLIKNRAVQLAQTNKAETNDFQAKLTDIFELHSHNTLDTMNAVLLLSFVQDYIDYVEKVSLAFKCLLPEDELKV